MKAKLAVAALVVATAAAVTYVATSDAPGDEPTRMALAAPTQTKRQEPRSVLAAAETSSTESREQAVSAAAGGALKHRLATAVPENWLPPVPVRTGTAGRIRLAEDRWSARMPRSPRPPGAKSPRMRRSRAAAPGRGESSSALGSTKQSDVSGFGITPAATEPET